ncbi:MAG: hypothetical protein AAF790_06010 [Planctomycetota bacterium]
MNTPAHVILSCVAVPHPPGWAATSALVAGALLPDAPMFVFYAVQKTLGRTERQIWSEDPDSLGLYFSDHWQLFFDVFNSLPLAALALAACWGLRQHGVAGAGVWQWGVLCAASAGLHMLCDLPLHNVDAHRHFLPFINWRFISPVSYWDPQHYGRWTLPAELLLTIAGALYLAWPGQPGPSRIIGAATLTIYALLACGAVVFLLSRVIGNN